MKARFILTVILIKLVVLGWAQTAQIPETAEQILKSAYIEAATDKKNVFVIFHASWCGWCHKMDDSMNDPSVKSFFQNNFIIRHMVVMESKGKEYLENPGAMDLLTKHRGNNEGIPFWLVFDKDGKLLADSKIRAEGANLDAEGKNSGCPATKEEVEHFINVLRKTTSLKETELTVIEKKFRENEQ